MLISILYFVPRWQVRHYENAAKTGSINAKEAADLENKFRATLASGLGGMVALVGLAGLWFTFQQVTYAGLNANAAAENVKLTAKSKNLDRLTTAVGYMSSDVLSQRIAGVTILGGVGLAEREDSEAALAALLAYLPEKIPFRHNDRQPLPDDIVGTFAQISRLMQVARPTDRLTLRGLISATAHSITSIFPELPSMRSIWKVPSSPRPRLWT